MMTAYEHEASPTERLFRPQSRYLLLALIGLVMTGAFAWSLSAPLRSGQPISSAVLLTGEGFFLLVSLAIALWFGRQARARVVLTSTAVELSMPLAPSRRAEFGQLMSVSESGRGGNAIVVLYHPRRDDGFLDLDDARSIVIPAVVDQEELLAALEARIPV